MLVRDAQLDDAFKGRMSIVEQKVHTMMAVPLETKDRIIGLIYVDSPFILREFTKNDLSLLTVMANVAAIRIEHARLAEVEAAERIMQRDLSQAAEIQGGMLPAHAPDIAGVDLAGFNVPCRTVGGDYYDFFPYPGRPRGSGAGRCFRQGHAGVADDDGPARARAGAGGKPRQPGRFMTRLNKATCANCPSNRFITFFFCVLDASNGRAAVRQCRPQSAGPGARLGRGRDAGRRRPGAGHALHRSLQRTCSANSIPATCWCSTATA